MNKTTQQLIADLRNAAPECVNYSGLLTEAADVLEKYTIPIQIGTKVYFVVSWNNSIESGIVSMIQQKRDLTWKFRISYTIGSSTFDTSISELGKTIFLTYDEAEKYKAEKY